MQFPVETIEAMIYTIRGHRVMLDSDLAKLYGVEAKRFLGFSRKPISNPFKLPDQDSRIYPGYFGQVLTLENHQLLFKPMRYRIRPAHSLQEIPSKFNVFNARLDSLTTRQTWTPLFMNKHGLLPFVRFFEWVEHEGQKRLISFNSSRHEVMWAPCLFDYWFNTKENMGFYSFAIITDDPPQEVWDIGHDRCPIFLHESLIQEWLSPQGKSMPQMLGLLKQKEATFYHHQWVS